jgi:hypothetical protein
MFKLPFILFLVCRVTYASELETGIAFYEDKQMVQALKLLEPLAIEGNSEAQYIVGEIYLFNGNKVKLDLEKAAIYLGKSAANGYIQAQYRLGYIFENEIIDYKKVLNAESWFSPDTWKEKVKQMELKAYMESNQISQQEIEAAKTYHQYTLPNGEAKNINPQNNLINERKYPIKINAGGYDPENDEGGFDLNSINGKIVIDNKKYRSKIKNDFSAAKNQCESLGFKPKTEKFAICVLELTK